METTHYSVVDAHGNAVATTTTLNGGYGSGVWIRGGGFFMNNEMDDFAAQPGTPNMFGLVQGEANAVQPGKRMLSAMSPTIVLDPAGKVLLVTGARGRPDDHHDDDADHSQRDRVPHDACPTRCTRRGCTIKDCPTSSTSNRTGSRVAAQDSLKAMGHTLGTRGLATANSIMRVPADLQGVGEPRSGGVAVGY